MTNVSTSIATSTAARVYDTPFKTRGQFMKELREAGKLPPRTPKANDAAIATDKSSDDKKAARNAFARRRYFANKAKAAKAAAETTPAKGYDTPFKTRGQWFKEMREAGKLPPRQPKVAAEPAQLA